MLGAGEASADKAAAGDSNIDIITDDSEDGRGRMQLEDSSNFRAKTGRGRTQSLDRRDNTRYWNTALTRPRSSSFPRLLFEESITDARMANYYDDAIMNSIPSPTLLRNLIEQKMFKGVRYLVRTHFDWIAQGEFDWLRDLPDDVRLSSYAVTTCLEESLVTDPWMSTHMPDVDELENLISRPTDDKHWNLFHQPNCIHQGPGTLGTGYQGDINKLLDSTFPDDVRREVTDLCGLGGAFPPNVRKPGMVSAMVYTTAKTGSSIFVKYEGAAKADDQISTLKEIFHSTDRCWKSLLYLQQAQFCCHTITSLVERDDGVIVMSRLDFREVSGYLEALKEISEASSWLSRFGRGKFYSCSSAARSLLKYFGVFEETYTLGWLRYVLPDLSKQESPTESLQFCALATQVLCVAVLSYSQAHTGSLQPHFLADPVNNITLEGYSLAPQPKLVANFTYRNLACMGNLLGGPAIVLRFSRMEFGFISQDYRPDVFGGAMIQNSIENIVDSWGPAVLVADSNERYGEKVQAVLIGGGTIFPRSPNHSPPKETRPACTHHWAREYPQEPLDPPSKFTIWQQLMIGAGNELQRCPLDPEKARKASEPCLYNLGTSSDSWRLAEKQLMLQAAQYVGL